MEIDYDRMHINDKLMLKEMEKRGITLSHIEDTDLIEACYGGQKEYLQGVSTRLVPNLYSHVLEDKFYTKQILKRNDIPVAEGTIFAPQDLKPASHYAEELGYPVVLKPTNGVNGAFVYANIKDEGEFNKAFSEIGETVMGPMILVEKYFEKAHDYRFFVTPNSTKENSAVVRREPPKVVGDGVSTIKELIYAENEKRKKPAKSCLHPIYIADSEGQRCLKHQHIDEKSVLKKGEEVTLRYNCSTSWGGECENVQRQVHDSFYPVCRQLLALFPGLPYLFIDLLIRDESLSATADNYIFGEFHLVKPGLSLFLTPSQGLSQDVVGPIVDMLFPATKAT